jgi:hypothetical protein
LVIFERNAFQNVLNLPGVFLDVPNLINTRTVVLKVKGKHTQEVLCLFFAFHFNDRALVDVNVPRELVNYLILGIVKFYFDALLALKEQ